MKNECRCLDWEAVIPAYLNGTLTKPLQEQVEQHLVSCHDCQQVYQSWLVIAQITQEETECIVPKRSVAETWEKLHVHITQKKRRASHPLRSFVHSAALSVNILAAHFWAQVRLLKSDLWWMSLLGLPLITVLLFLPASWQSRADASAFVAAFTTALGMAFLYGQEVDPAHEMVLATPTSSRFLLLNRIGLVFTFDLLVNSIEVLPFFLHQGTISLQWVIMNWLAPLCCLTALSLLLSVLARPTFAVLTCTLLWVLRLFSNPVFLPTTPLQQAYEHFWHQDVLLFSLAILTIMLVFFVVERKEVSTLWFNHPLF